MASAAVLIHPPSSPSSATTTTTTTTTAKVTGSESQHHPNIYSYKPAPLGLSTTSSPTRNVRERESSGSKYGSRLAPQEVHVVKVTAGDTVQIEPAVGPVERGKSLQDPCANQYAVGPPPPSPPASVEENGDIQHRQGQEQPEQQPEQDTSPSSSRMLHLVQSDPTASRNASLDYDRKPTPTASPRILDGPIRISSPQPLQQPLALQRSSTDTRAAYGPPTPRTIITQPSPPPPSAERFENGNAEASTSTPSPSTSKAAAAHLSIDGYLQPPTLLSQKPTRRNTTGSTPTSSHSRRERGMPGPHSKVSSQPFATTEDAMLGEGGLELASDIELHAERIRRERMSKRAKQQQQQQQAEAEAAALTQAESVGGMSGGVSVGGGGGAGRTVEDAPLVGNLIGEDHVNYVLMYNMLTGIRTGVSRCQAKVKRPLTDEDFTARHKYSFDIVGNELTPSAKYDFKFKDYAPWVFRYLREDIFHLDPADYLLSLTAKYILSELGSPGKSGSFFYFSRDYKYIIKTIRHSEHKFLLKILKRYYAYVKENPHTLLSRFYGLHRVKLPRGRKIHFVIMNNLFPAHKDIHETYDLKGSTVGREYPEEKAAKNPRAVLKDLNWIKRGKRLELGPEKRALLTEQVRRDEEFLRSIHVMDYSLLVGIHHLERGNKENVRRNTLKVFSPNLPEARRTKTSQSGSQSPEAIALRRAMRISDPKRLGKHTIRLPESDTGDRDRQEFVFYQDEGGLRATNDRNEDLGAIYYLGVIDILTPWGALKKAEGFWKGLGDDRHKISPVPPDEYAERFFAFIKAIMRGGDGLEKFLPQPHAGPCGPLCCIPCGSAHAHASSDEALPARKAPHALTGVAREREKAREEVQDLARREEEWIREDVGAHERGDIGRGVGSAGEEALDEKREVEAHRPGNGGDDQAYEKVG